MDWINRTSDKVDLFYKNIFSAIIPQGKYLILTVILQCSFLVLFWFWFTLAVHEPNQYWFFSPGIFLLGILGAMLAGIIAAVIVKSFQYLPYLFLVVIAFALVIGAYTTSSFANNWQTALVIYLWLILPPMLIGFGKFYIEKKNRGKVIFRITGWIFLVCGSLSILLGMLWIVFPGFSSQNQLPEIVDTRPALPPLPIENPAEVGAYSVLTLTYGSGTDKNRKAYGEDVVLITQSVDGSVFLPSLEKFPGWLYKQQWGFDKTELPLNGRVWYPNGEGPFPLVLIVHGNHTALDFSDEGYAYLGELLASRGMIFVSVDENFLNSSWINAISDDYSHQENDARGWLLLRHLQQFRAWDGENDNPFYEKVDWNKIALIGHSRGGEAVTEAANFNNLGTYPDNGNISFPKPFNIQALIAIAPVDNQYNPASKDTPIENINYLVIQGSADADLKNFPGQAAYSRVMFTNSNEFYFKSSVYLHRANHGQFNTTWGAADNGKLSYYILNRQFLLDEETQQRIAKVLISAFLEATLNENKAYQEIFEEPRTGSSWIPESILWTQYADSTETVLINFEEDINLKTGSIPDSEIGARNFDTWRESILYGNRNRAIGNNVVSLAWNSEDKPNAAYEINFNNPVSFALKKMFVFSAAVTTETDEAAETITPVNFSIELSDGITTATVSTSEYALLYENPVLSLSKASFMNSINGADTVLQTIQIPLAAFQSNNPAIDFSYIQSITFHFDQTPQGRIWIDDIGVR